MSRLEPRFRRKIPALRAAMPAPVRATFAGRAMRAAWIEPPRRHDPERFARQVGKKILEKVRNNYVAETGSSPWRRWQIGFSRLVAAFFAASAVRMYAWRARSTAWRNRPPPAANMLTEPWQEPTAMVVRQ